MATQNPSKKPTPTPPRSRRSNINLADLRLSPLSVKYTPPPKQSDKSNPEAPAPAPADLSFSRSHSSYLQGKSAPTSPGILSRSSSRKSLGAGLRRRSSVYDNDGYDGDYGDVGSGGEDAAVVREGERVGITRVPTAGERGGSKQIPKAKSEAALLVERSRLQLRKQQQKSSSPRLLRAGGDSARSLAKTKSKPFSEDWITRTGATANAFLQESKGQSWIASRESSTSLTHLQDTTDDDDDEGYEELAAQSVAASRQQLFSEEMEQVSPRLSRWGSRYGSRTVSRRTSRRGSVVNLTTAGSRTPLASQDAATGYFDEAGRGIPMEPDFIDGEDEIDSQDEAVLAELAETRSFGLGGLVDRIMNFGLFNVEEKEEATEDEGGINAEETVEEAKARMKAENLRKKEEKERLTKRPTEDGDGDEKEDGKGEGGWADAAWLLSVASKAIF